LKGNKTALQRIEVQDEHTDAWTGIFEEALPKG
jgi:hypothetical protein